MLDPAASVRIGLGAARPDLGVERESAGEAAIEGSLGDAAWSRRLAPRHRRAVEGWFAPPAGRDGE